MNVTYRCPQCNNTVRTSIATESDHIACPKCAGRIAVPAGAIADGHLTRCLVCPSSELFARKDFPQRLGVALVAMGFIGSSIAWANYQVLWSFAILFGTALIDLILYLVMGESLTCYRCQAQYRGFEEIERHGGFDLETHERYRQMAARLKSQTTQSGKTLAH